MSWRLRVDIWEIAYMDNFPNSLPQKKKKRNKQTNVPQEINLCK